MADRSSQMLLQAPSRAAAGGVPLLAGRTSPGLFPATPAGKQAAQRCRDDGYLVEQGDACALSDKGRAVLLENVAPRDVLEDFVRALEVREAQTAQLVAQVREAHAALAAMRREIEPFLDQARRLAGPLNGLFEKFREGDTPRPPDVKRNILTALERWSKSGALGDCPLPDVYRQSGAQSIGGFHDALRQLRDEGRLHLHPWTAPLYQMPEPPYALLVGHDVTYYASLRAE